MGCNHGHHLREGGDGERRSCLFCMVSGFLVVVAVRDDEKSNSEEFGEEFVKVQSGA